MHARQWITIGALCALLNVAGPTVMPLAAAPVGSAFTYQGKLDKSGTPSNGSHNFEFKLYDALSAGTQIGVTQTLNGVAVTTGLFTVPLDFGASAFDGNGRWLEIKVQGPGDASFTTLTPRQTITATPYALHALNVVGGGLTLPFVGSSTTPSGPSVSITNNGAGGYGLYGEGALIGAYGKGGQYGTYGDATDYGAYGTSIAGTGVYGASSFGYGVQGIHNNSSGDQPGVFGRSYSFSTTSVGTAGTSGAGRGVLGTSTSGSGVHGVSTTGFGVYGSTAGALASGVFGQTSADNAAGVLGRNESGVSGQAVYGYASSAAVGVMGISEGNDGMYARTNAADKSAIYAFATHINSVGGRFYNTAGGVALFADGIAKVRTLQILGGADIAERFDVATPADGSEIRSGMIVAIDESNTGALRLADAPYDTRVAGIISGANGLSPGMVLKAEGDPHADGAHAVAMTGRVWCWVDATAEPVEPGDLLTTSSTPGMAMRASDAARRPGAVIGKAMTRLEGGRGLVLVLVSLQ